MLGSLPIQALFEPKAAIPRSNHGIRDKALGFKAPLFFCLLYHLNCEFSIVCAWKIEHGGS